MISQLFFAVALSAGTEIGEVKIHGPVGDRMDAMIENHVKKTDPCYLSHAFHSHTEKHYFAGEFWGKYMHSAPYYWAYTHSSELKEKIEKGVKDVIASQMPDGYIGYYDNEARLRPMTWDLWGCKYCLLGLITWYDVTKDQAALESAKKLCDYLIKWFDPKAGHAPLHETGWVAGLASCSVLEPVVWLYERTKEPRYLEFAKYIYAECDVEDPTPEKKNSFGPALISMALAGVSVNDRSAFGSDRNNRRKAYEMMSCYQGILDYYEVTGDKNAFKAAQLSVENILTNEINLAGSGAAREFWYNGRAKQHLPYTKNQETCVTTTWMRLLEKMFFITGDPKYVDAIEQTFYNAYLGAMKSDGSSFVTYSPLAGFRYFGQNHCFLFTNCCNANGPRGFLVFLEAMLRAREDEVYLSLYNAAETKIKLPKNGTEVKLDIYTLYPKDGEVLIWNRTVGEAEFALKLRIPAWSETTKIYLNDKEQQTKISAGTFFEMRRNWKEGDRLRIVFDMKVRRHLLDHAIAFTAGPILLARDNRFNDGDLSEVLSYSLIDACYATPWLRGSDREPAPVSLDFKPERLARNDMWMTWTARLPVGCHVENPDGKRYTTLHFCDYSSAGGEWCPSNYYRTWLPIEYVQWE